jgi:hypothetical protein
VFGKFRLDFLTKWRADFDELVLEIWRKSFLLLSIQELYMYINETYMGVVGPGRGIPGHLYPPPPFMEHGEQSDFEGEMDERSRKRAIKVIKAHF